MSARMEFVGRQVTRHPSETEVEVLFQNFDQNNLVAPLREVHAAKSQMARLPEGSEEKCRAALALQEKWESWLVRRELLRNDLKRGKELLEQTQKELAQLRHKLEEWPSYERICGRNPLQEYMQELAAYERIEKFLPMWLKRRESELTLVTQSLEQCARENGLEHLL